MSKFLHILQNIMAIGYYFFFISTIIRNYERRIVSQKKNRH